MSEELKLKPCPRCWKNVYVIRANGCKFIRCDCGIQSSRYGEHITDRRMVADWNRRPVEDAQAARIAELEAERDRLREVVEKLVWLYSDEHQERLDNELRIDGFYSHEWLGMILDMAREAMKGAEE